VIDNHCSDSFLNKALTLVDIKKISESLIFIEKARAINPDNSCIYFNKALILNDLGEFKKSLECFNQAINLQYEGSEIYVQRGFLLVNLGRHDEAVLSFQKAILIKCDEASTYSHLSLALKELHLYPEALSHLEKSLYLKNDDVNIFIQRASIYIELKKFDEALDNCNQAIVLNEDIAEIYINQGIALRGLKKWDEALSAFNKAIVLNADNAIAYNNRGLVFHDLKIFDKALVCYYQAIQLKSDYDLAYSNLSISLFEMRQFEKALHAVEQSIALKNNFSDAYIVRGLLFHELNKIKEAIRSYDFALILSKDSAAVHFNKSLSLLLNGDFINGFNEYEWRWKYEKIELFPTYLGKKRKFSQPLWLGQVPLKGRTLLLYSEQGLGDTIQFCRYALIAVKLGARVILETYEPLCELFESLPGIADVVTVGSELPYFDLHCSLLSMPFALRTDIHNIPLASGYIKSNVNKVLKWKNFLGKKTKPRIGIVWSSFSNFKGDDKRSISLAQLLTAFPTDEVDYICLQMKIKDSDKATLALHPNIKFLGDRFTNFSDTAALIDCVDLVISTCTSMPHLSGSLGKETWILLSHVPDWRWMLDRVDSPWYSSVKLFRQERKDDWDSVFSKVKSDLKIKFNLN
jgi:hypothetical protein